MVLAVPLLVALEVHHAVDPEHRLSVDLVDQEELLGEALVQAEVILVDPA